MADGILDERRRQQRNPDTGGARATEVRGRLVLATVTCIERHGLAGATVRRITAEAGVNIAAVNYYFGSKDALLDEVFASTLHEAFPKALGELHEAIAAADGDIRVGTAEFLRGYLQYAFNYPRLSTAHLQEALFTGEYGGATVRSLREFLRGFERAVAPAIPMATPIARRVAVVQVWAAILQLAMLRDAYELPLEESNGPAMVDGFLAVLFRAS